MKTKTMKIAIATILLSSTVAFAAVNSDPYAYDPDIDYKNTVSYTSATSINGLLSEDEFSKIDFSSLKTDNDKFQYYLNDYALWFNSKGDRKIKDSTIDGLKALDEKGMGYATFTLAKYYRSSVILACEKNWKCIKEHGIDPNAEKYYQKAADMDITGEASGQLTDYYRSVRTKEAREKAKGASDAFVAKQNAYRENRSRQASGI
ncbi:hypothetical protein EHJ37_19790 [Vibrio parahaemolyticus]|nr:hypothetical protein [Vibrio parahaemolyticus]